MPAAPTVDELTAARLHAQLLAGERPDDVAAAVRHMVAVQAQLPSAARLALRARTAGSTVVDVDRAIAEGRLIRTWLMRGTLHLLAAEDLRWLVAVLGPHSVTRGRRRREQLGLDEATCERGLTAIGAILRGSAPLTRAQLITELAARGVAIDAATQAPAHLVAYAANRGLICGGADVDTFVLIDEWVAPAEPLPREDALAELARRYLASHAPADVPDFVAWSGLPAGAARRAVELASGPESDPRADPMSDPTPDPVPGRPAVGAPGRLLGHFDPLLLGYCSRDFVLDPAQAKRIQAGGGFIRPVALVDGRIVGTWRLERTDRLVVEPFDALPTGSRDALAADADDVGRFLGRTLSFALA